MTKRNPPQGANRKALEETIKASSFLTGDQSSAIVQLARTLADQVDAAGPEVSTRLTAAYLSALKDIARASRPGAAPRVPQPSTTGPVRVPDVGGHGRGGSWRDAS